MARRKETPKGPSGPSGRTDKPASRQRAHADPSARHAPRPSTLAQQQAFLQHFASIGVVTAAAKLAGIERQRHYEWLQAPDKYPGYAEQYAAAMEEAADRCEAEMMRRGVAGWDEPVYGKLPGEQTGNGVIGSKRVYSDRMLELALKARRPEKFRERYEHTGPNGGPIKSEVHVFQIPDNGR